MRRLAATVGVLACAACSSPAEPTPSSPAVTSPATRTAVPTVPITTVPSTAVPSTTVPSTTVPSTTVPPPLTAAQRDRADARLLAAAESGSTSEATAALRSGARIEARNGRRQTPLLLAATHDRVAVARLLVTRGADPDALDYRHDTPWLVTGVTGSVAMLETLLPADPDLTIRNRFGGLSPIPAAERGHVEYLRRVVRTDVDLDHVNDSGWTALLEAVILGDGGRRHQQVVRVLVAAGVDTSIGDRDGVTAIEHARARGYATIVDILGGDDEESR